MTDNTGSQRHASGLSPEFALPGFLREPGDFDISMMVAGNIPGRTQTMSMANYDAVQANNLSLANQLALMLSSSGFGLLFLVLRLRQKTEVIP